MTTLPDWIPQQLAPYWITAFFASPYDDNKTCTSLLGQSYAGVEGCHYRLCRLENLSQFHQLDYLGNSIAASAAVAGGGDKIR